MGGEWKIENMVAATEEIKRRAAGYINWPRENVMTAFMLFEETFGIGKIQAMGRFMDWAEENHKERGWIRAQIGHDLNGAMNSDMSPRTGGY